MKRHITVGDGHGDGMYLELNCWKIGASSDFNPSRQSSGEGDPTSSGVEDQMTVRRRTCRESFQSVTIKLIHTLQMSKVNQICKYGWFHGTQWVVMNFREFFGESQFTSVTPRYVRQGRCAIGSLLASRSLNKRYLIP